MVGRGTRGTNLTLSATVDHRHDDLQRFRTKIFRHYLFLQHCYVTVGIFTEVGFGFAHHHILR